MSRKTDAEFIQVVGGMIRAAGRRCADGNTDDLALLVGLGNELNAAITTAVAGQRAHGVFWSSIGEAIGTSKENAIQRWGPRRRR